MECLRIDVGRAEVYIRWKRRNLHLDGRHSCVLLTSLARSRNFREENKKNTSLHRHQLCFPRTRHRSGPVDECRQVGTHRRVDDLAPTGTSRAWHDDSSGRACAVAPCQSSAERGGHVGRRKTRRSTTATTVGWNAGRSRVISLSRRNTMSRLRTGRRRRTRTDFRTERRAETTRENDASVRQLVKRRRRDRARPPPRVSDGRASGNAAESAGVKVRGGTDNAW